MRLRLSPGPIARVLRNLGYTPGRDVRLPYAVELDPIDYPLGTTITGVTLVVALDFGDSPLLTKQITTLPSVNGQITDDGADGTGFFTIAIAGSELLPFRPLGPLAFEVVVTDSRGFQASFDAGSLVPAASTAGKPVDHVLITPNPFVVGFPATQQLTATAYDEDSNVLVGRAVQWSVSDPTIATVDANGVVTVVAAGAVIVTATIEGHSATSTGTTSVPPNLPALLDFAPAMRVADLIAPAIFPTNETPTGWAPGVPNYPSSTHRIEYPHGDEKWYQVIPGIRPFSQPSTGGAQNGGIETLNFAVGPEPASHVSRIQFPGGAVNAKTNISGSQDLDATDQQDLTDYIHSYLVRIKANIVGSVGRLVHFELDSRTTFLLLRSRPIVVPANWQTFSYDFATSVERTDSLGFRSVISDNDGTLMDMQVEGGWGDMPHRTRPRIEESYWPGPWHRTFGMLAQNGPITFCWWPSNNPGVTGGATKATDAADAPDAGDFHSGRKYFTFMLPANRAGAIAMLDGGGNPVYEKVVQFDPGTGTELPPFEIFVHIKGKPLTGQPKIADGVLEGQVQAQGGPLYTAPMDATTFCPKPMQDADGGAGYYARCIVNSPTKILTGTAAGSNYVIDFGAAHPFSVGETVFLGGGHSIGDGAVFPLVVAVISAKTATTITIPYTAAGNGVGGDVRYNHRFFQPLIRNTTASALTFRGYRPQMWTVGEADQRNTGWHDAWVPREAITGPVKQTVAWPNIQNPSLVMGRTEGFLIMRQLWPFPIGDAITLGIGKRDFCQGGPFGTAHVFIAGGINPDPVNNLIKVSFQSSWDTGYQSWGASILLTPGSDRFPRFCPFDLILGWRTDVDGVTKLFHLGIGHGAGTSVTWFANGDAWLGGVWSIDSTPGTQWDYSIDPDKHLGLMSDLDITGLPGGWLMAVQAGNTVPVDFRARVEYHIASAAKWGPRVDYMAA